MATPSLRELSAWGRPLAGLLGTSRIRQAGLVGTPLGSAAAPLSVAVFGGPWDLDGARRWFFASEPRTTQNEEVALAALPGAMREASRSADLVLVAIPRALRFLIPSGFSVLPRTVRVRASVAEIEQGLTRRTGKVGQHLRRAEQGGFCRALHADGSSLARFYEELYLPFRAQQFGRRTSPLSLGFFLDHRDHGELLVLEQAGEWVAAAFGIRRDQTYEFMSLGYSTGDFDPKETGAGHALYGYVFERALELGLSTVDLFTQAPLLNDSLLVYKRQWGGRLFPDPWQSHLLGLGFPRRDSRLLDLFRAQPLIFRTSSGGLAVASPEPERIADRDRIRRRASDVGIDEVGWIGDDYQFRAWDEGS